MHRYKYVNKKRKKNGTSISEYTRKIADRQWERKKRKK